MSHNSFGHLFRVTTWGESHGPAIGCVVDGVPPGLSLTAGDIQVWLDRRKPGQSRFTTQRREPDAVDILSGTVDGVTTGTALSLVIRNQDQRSQDYGEIKDQFRPGHADYTYWEKYGVRDHRGGGRASARETALRVAAGAVARRLLARDFGTAFWLRGALVRIGPHSIDRARWDWAATETNPFWCPDPVAAGQWGAYLDGVRKAGSSAGAVIEVVAGGVPAGLGAPIYGKLDADLAAAMMSINAVKGVEIGDGFAAAALSGEDNADEILPPDPSPGDGPTGEQRQARHLEPGHLEPGHLEPGHPASDGTTAPAGRPRFRSNHAGGILGGISTGQDIVARFAVKATSSILTPRQSIDRFGNPARVVTKGRHDPCVGIRAVPVGEAMMACALADHWLRHKAQCIDSRPTPRPFDQT